MRVIELDATGWNTILDFYDTLLAELGAPDWHGRSVGALIDSMIWGGINSVEPPFIVQVHGLSAAPGTVADEVRLVKQALTEARAEFHTRNGGDVNVELQTVP
jgi:hypothetical protein